MLLQTHARLFPERAARQVAGLVMIDATYTNPTYTARNRGALQCIERPIIRPMLHVARHLSPFVRLINTAAYLNGSLHLATRLAMFGKTPSWARLDHLVRLLIRTPMRVVVPMMFAMFDHDETATLVRIKVPVLLVVGQRDRWTPPACHEFMASQIPHSKLDVVAEAGHLPFLEQPELVAETISEFFANCLEGRAQLHHRLSSQPTS
jgi:pimeloyl-ACP methyl ester carboxylesterase